MRVIIRAVRDEDVEVADPGHRSLVLRCLYYGKYFVATTVPEDQGEDKDDHHPRDNADDDAR